MAARNSTPYCSPLPVSATIVRNAALPHQVHRYCLCESEGHHACPRANPSLRRL